jgi:hypothetical protein
LPIFVRQQLIQSVIVNNHALRIARQWARGNLSQGAATAEIAREADANDKEQDGNR